MNTSKNTCVYVEVHMCKYKFEHIQFCTVDDVDRERRKRAKRLAGSPGPGRRNRMFDVMNLEHYHTFPQVLRLQLAQQTMLGVMKWIQKLLVVGPLGWVLIRWCTKDLVCNALLYFCWLWILPSMCSMCYFAAMDGEVLDALKKVLADRERQGTLVSKKVGSSRNREPWRQKTIRWTFIVCFARFRPEKAGGW